MGDRVISIPSRKASMRRATVLLVLLLSALGAGADGGRRAAVPLPPPPPAYRGECGSCHLPYPPGMLPAASWARLLQNLPRHFGTDASLDPGSVQELSAWLALHAATSQRGREAPPEDRITRSAWFQREHHEIAPATWNRPSIRGAANCAACHAQAEQGVFDEHRVRIPR